MPTTPEGQILNSFLPVYREFVERFAKPNACVATTRLAVDALRELGVDCEPLEVVAVAYNPPLARWIKLNDRLPGERDLNAIRMVLPQAWSAGTGEKFDDLEADWYGHVVAVAMGTVLIDGSTRQMQHPDKNLFLPAAVAFPVTDDFLDGQGTAALDIGDSLLTYRRTADPDEYYRETGDWVDPERIPAAVDALVRATRDRLG